MSGLKEQWQNVWQGLTPEKRRMLTVGTLIVGLGAVIFISYFASGQKEKNAQPKPVAKMQSLKLGDQLLEDDVRSSINKDRAIQEDVNKQLTKKIEDAANAQQQTAETLTAMRDVLEELKGLGGVPSTDPSKNGGRDSKRPASARGPAMAEVEGNFKYPPPPQPDGDFRAQPANYQKTAAAPAVDLKVEYVGGIGHGSGEVDPLSRKPEAKKKRSVFLPPGFMQAKLLTGVRARTAQQARDNPQQVMFRVQEPAVLPNSVKADLQGCFVLGNITASLDTERIDVRLANLTCMAQNGHAAIDQEVHGYVADEGDGQVGLAGIPVTKAGANMMRAFIVGSLGGLGEIVKAESLSQSTNALGTTTTIDSDKISRAMIGNGLVEASTDLKKIFIDLIKQSSPILETGPSKDVTIVITEGANLEIKEYDFEDE